MTNDGQNAQEPIGDDGHESDHEVAHDPDAVERALPMEEEQAEQSVEAQEQAEVQARLEEEHECEATQTEGASPDEQVSSENTPEQDEEAEHSIKDAPLGTTPRLPTDLAQAHGKEKALSGEETKNSTLEVNADELQPDEMKAAANANVEMPAISKDLARASRDADATDPAQSSSDDEPEASQPERQPGVQTADGSAAEGASLARELGRVPEKKVSPAALPMGSAGKSERNGRRSNNGDDPHGVQDVLDELPLWREDSQLLRANYPTTTAYRVAIKKKRYTTVGNTLFLVLCAILLLGSAGAFFIYFAPTLASSTSRISTSTKVAQKTPQSDAPLGNLAGAETAAPRASGSVLTGYQWIHDETKHEIYIDANNHIQELATSDEQTWQITDLTKRSGAAVPNGRALAGFEWQHESTAQVVYIDAKQHVQQLYSSGGSQWDVIDLTRKAQAPLANGATIAGYEWTPGGSKQVVYIDQRGHIQELATSNNTTWRVSDLTALSKAPPANGRVLSAYQWGRQGSKQVDYIDLNQHVRELSFTGGSWHVSDLNALVGAPLANGKTLTSYEWQQTGARQIAYLDTNNHLQLLTGTSVNNWSLADLTLLSRAPLANGNTLVGYEWQQGGRNVLYFVDSKNHVQELSEAPDESWQLADLSQAVQQAPPSNGKIIFGYDWAQHGSKQVIYIDNTNTVQELTSGKVPGKWELSSWKRI